MDQYEELKHTGQLPSPSGVGMQVLVLTQDEDCPIDELVRVIQIDPALTGKVVKLASSVQLTGSGIVPTVKDAAMRLGTRTVSNVALGFTLISGNRSGRCRAFPYDRYWSWSLANAVAAQIVARELRIASPAESFTCGLLIRVGELALASLHPTEYAEILEHCQDDPKTDPVELEKQYFRIDRRELAQAMLDDWGLPKHYGLVAGAFDPERPHEPIGDAAAEDLMRVMRASSAIADLCLSDDERQPYHMAGLREVCLGLGVGATEFCRLFDRVAPEWKEWGKMLQVPTRPVMTFAELEARAARLGAPERKEPGFGTGLRILAVDDDPVSLRLLVQHLERAGHYVLTAANGRDALAVALEANPQIVVTDWMMPEMDGLDLCKTLRRNAMGRNLYILILTGRAEEDRIVEAFEAGVDDYIVKPFKPKLLRARIRGGQRVVHLQEQVERDKKTQQEHLNKLAVLTRKLRQAAMTDPLTDLPNRRYAMKRMEMEWANSNRSSIPFSLIMLDIDHFKRVNDQYGHDVGDQVLTSTAKAINRILRRGDVCARIGGEEFLVICPNTDGPGAEHVAERIREHVERTVTIGEDGDENITVSLGVATRSGSMASFDALIKAADEAVYQAKEAGRNRVVRWRPERPECDTA